MIKLMAIDIDDTLLNSHGQLLASTKHRVQQLLASDVKVVLCSGRPFDGVKPFLTELGITGDDQYVITNNGALVQTATGQILAQSTLTADYYAKLAALSVKTSLGFNAIDTAGNIYTANANINKYVVMQASENQAGLFVRDVADLPTDLALTKGVFVGEPDQLDAHLAEIQAGLATGTYIVRSAPVLLEVMSDCANKGNGLFDLTSYLGLAPAEVLAIGDADNDLPMFEFAGIAVSMGNGGTNAKAAADYITTSNDEDGVAHTIEKFLLTPVS
ncbi:Cof-type HAD-IIB family hydrolase [Lactiplantibacillus sp. WILCCON 0030]|uniref:Cof-type HAD-IIB family hydrolase n=1 Tax=Lactiplantibacillus brownii TaxID=3069269 RepID=A0ABU1A7N5_9LACO|nr:Cof-type HAD-IIB family hydrolase [Lactiplantibacillus brownii]MDQ7936675.1 Cof-type HAD-IIB family hydrolase [Lactiplantibacillus brownii]